MKWGKIEVGILCDTLFLYWVRALSARTRKRQVLWLHPTKTVRELCGVGSFTFVAITPLSKLPRSSNTFRVSSMGQIDLFEIVWNDLWIINIPTLKTLILQQNMKCLPVGNDCEDTFLYGIPLDIILVKPTLA